MGRSRIDLGLDVLEGRERVIEPRFKSSCAEDSWTPATAERSDCSVKAIDLVILCGALAKFLLFLSRELQPQLLGDLRCQLFL